MSHEPLVTEEMIARQPPEAQAIIRILLAKIEQLEARINRTSRNSSKPPSAEHPHAQPKPSRKRSDRKPGGQPGHDKHARTLIPVEHCAAVVPLKPENCRRCGTSLRGSDPEPLRHQVWELPEIQPFVTEYRRHRLCCAHCGATTCAPLPAGVPESQAGPRLTALVALLMGNYRQSKRRTATFLAQCFNIPASPGWIVKLQNRATRALAPAYDELKRRLPGEPVLGIDESPTKEGPLKSWLWTFVAENFTLFAQRTTRGATVLDEHLSGSFAGIVTCDRAKMYWRLPKLQWCWSHLERDFQGLADHPNGQVQRLGKDLLGPTGELFGLWRRCRDGTLTRTGLKRLLRPIREKIEGLLLRGVFSGNTKLAGMCGELHAHRDRLWRFAESEGVEPTNNASERALRPAVIWRKLSFGTRSAQGSRFVETLLSVVETCRRQSWNVFEYLTTALEAQLAGQPIPSLLSGV